MNENIPFVVWMEIFNYLDLKTKILLYRNFPNVYQLKTHILKKIHKQMAENAPNVTNAIDFFKFPPTFLHISLRNLVHNYGFLESIFAISDSICCNKKRRLIITTQNNFVFYLVKKTNQKIILFYDIKEVDNVCYLILHRNKDMKRQYGKLFERRDKINYKTFCDRVFYL
tara:strand:- start:47 stop:556 length:510 start_codon:yes stop_codon:yes gene_type:complete